MVTKFVSKFFSLFIDWVWHGDKTKADYTVKSTMHPNLYGIENMFDTRSSTFWHGVRNHGDWTNDDWVR